MFYLGLVSFVLSKFVDSIKDSTDVRLYGLV